MSNTFFGVGTRFYGKEDTRPDGSYLATKWFVVAYIPVVPLGSFRVRPVESAAGMVSSGLPPLTTRVDWQKRHVINVYAFIGAIALASITINHRANQPSATSTVPARLVKGKALPPDRTNPDYTRPTTAENGSPFPEVSGYIEGYEQQLNEGYSYLAVNNTQNTTDLYAKLYALETDLSTLVSSTPVRVFFVQAEGSFVVKNLESGVYELRYQDLDTGGLAKTDGLKLDKKLEDGQYYSKGIEVTLSPMINGNLETEPISEEDF